MAKNYRMRLNEYCQKNNVKNPEWNQEVPDGVGGWQAQILFFHHGRRLVTDGFGKTKAEARERAARELIDKLEEETPRMEIEGPEEAPEEEKYEEEKSYKEALERFCVDQNVAFNPKSSRKGRRDLTCGFLTVDNEFYIGQGEGDSHEEALENLCRELVLKLQPSFPDIMRKEEHSYARQLLELKNLGLISRFEYESSENYGEKKFVCTLYVFRDSIERFGYRRGTGKTSREAREEAAYRILVDLWREYPEHFETSPMEQKMKEWRKRDPSVKFRMLYLVEDCDFPKTYQNTDFYEVESVDKAYDERVQAFRLGVIAATNWWKDKLVAGVQHEKEDDMLHWLRKHDIPCIECPLREEK